LASLWAATEERELLPLVMDALTPTCWARIDAAFAQHKGPMFIAMMAHGIGHDQSAQIIKDRCTWLKTAP